MILEKKKAINKKYYRNNRKEILKKQSEYYFKNKARINRSHRLWSKARPKNKSTGRKRDLEKEKIYNRKTKYGITEEQFQKMLKNQKWLCAICRCRETTVDKSGKVKTLSIDHNHKTNEIRKLLCHRCNLGIGVFKDSWKLLQSASNYLRTNKRLVSNG